MSDKRVVRDDGDRDEQMAASMAAARESGDCVFCTIARCENEAQMPFDPPINGWVIAECHPAERHTAIHLLLISFQHPTGNHFDDLPDSVRAGAEEVIAATARRFGFKDWGYTVVSRRSGDGRHTAQTILHPSYHIIVSDGKPVSPRDIDPLFLRILQDYESEIVDHYKGVHPERADRKFEKGGYNALLSEALREFWMGLADYRSLLDGKAGGIWVKISNEDELPEVIAPRLP